MDGNKHLAKVVGVLLRLAEEELGKGNFEDGHFFAHHANGLLVSSTGTKIFLNGDCHD